MKKIKTKFIVVNKVEDFVRYNKDISKSFIELKLLNDKLVESYEESIDEIKKKLDIKNASVEFLNKNIDFLVDQINSTNDNMKQLKKDNHIAINAKNNLIDFYRTELNNSNRLLNLNNVRLSELNEEIEELKIRIDLYKIHKETNEKLKSENLELRINLDNTQRKLLDKK